MRSSLFRLAAQFIRNKDQVFDHKIVRKDYFKVTGAVYLVQAILVFVIEEFAFPTPDVWYDIRRVISPDFASYSKFGEIGGRDYKLENSLRAFNVTKARIDELRETGVPKDVKTVY